MRVITFGMNHFLSIILAASSVLTGFSAASPAQSPRVDGFGVEMNALPPLTVENIEPLMLQVESTGVRYIRQEIDWSLIETSPDVYDWSAVVPLDLLFASANAHDIQIVATLIGGPSYLASSGQLVDRSALRDRWQNFVQAAVDHFGEVVDIWEIGSAVNSSYALTPFLSPLSPDDPVGPDPAYYTKLLRSASKIIKTADPNDQVWLGSLTGVSASDCAMNPLTFILEVNAAKGWSSMDAILYQPNQGSAAPEYPATAAINSACVSSLMVTPASITEEVQTIQDLARQLGGKPVIVTGLSWSGDDLAVLSSDREISSDQVEADLLVRASTALMAQNSIPTIFWHTDISSNPSSLNALINLQQSLRNTKPLGQVQGQDGSVYEYRFRKGGEYTIIAWRTLEGDAPYPVTLEVSDIPSLTAWTDDSAGLSKDFGLQLPANDSNQVVVMLNERPVIFIGRSGDLLSNAKQTIEDQAELWKIEAQNLLSQWLNNAKAEFMDLLAKELDKAKESAIQWGENKLDELLP